MTAGTGRTPRRLARLRGFAWQNGEFGQIGCR
jgi:hypothetical protein